MYNRASNLMAQSSRTSNNEIGQKNVSEEKNLENNVQNEMPKSLQSRINVETKEEISIEKTQEILDQINQYLDEEKKKMN